MQVHRAHELGEGRRIRAEKPEQRLGVLGAELAVQVGADPALEVVAHACPPGVEAFKRTQSWRESRAR